MFCLFTCSDMIFHEFLDTWDSLMQIRISG